MIINVMNLGLFRVIIVVKFIERQDTSKKNCVCFNISNIKVSIYVDFTLYTQDVVIPYKYNDTLFFTRKTWYTSCDYSYAGNSCEGFMTGGCWRGVVVCWGSKQGLPKCHTRPPLSLLLIVFCFLKILRQRKRTFFNTPHTQKN